MAGLRRFLSPWLENFKKFPASRLQRRCLYLKKDLISTANGNAESHPFNDSELDVLKEKNNSGNPIGYKSMLGLKSNIRIGNDSAIGETSEQIKFEAKGKSLAFISNLLEEIPLDKENVFQVCRKLNMILQYNNFSPEELEAFINKNDIKKLFCALEKYLHTFTCTQIQIILSLFLLCNLPTSNSVMQKTLTLALVDINKFSPMAIFSTYLKIPVKDEESEYMKSLKLACLNYMAHCFKDKGYLLLSPKDKYFYSSGNLAYFLTKKDLPMFIRVEIKNILSGYNIKLESPIILMHLMKGIRLFSCEKYNDPRFNKMVQHFLKNLICRKKEKCLPKFATYFLKSYVVGVLQNVYEYNEELCDEFASLVITGLWDLSTACTVMYLFFKIDHSNVSLQDYVFRKCRTTEIDILTALTLLRTFSKIYFAQLDDYTQHFFRNTFESYDFTDIFNMDPNILTPHCKITVSLGLALMGVYRKEIIDMTFEAITVMFDNSLFSEQHMHTLQEALLIHQWVSVLHPSHKNKLREDVLDKCCRFLIEKVNFSLWQDAIMNTFGTDYVLAGCVTSSRHFPSYVMVLGPGNKPLNLSSYNKVPIDIETIQKPENSKIVVIQEIPEEFSEEIRNVPVCKPKEQLYFKILETLGYEVITLEQKQFNKLSEPLKKLYITSKFEDKFGKVDFVKDSAV